jgi:DNA-binding response OmpR family regulator
MLNKKPKVLLIEDELEIRENLAEILQDHYQVALAEDGIRGIKESIRNTPDVILLDIKMPKLDGFQTCEALRQEQSTVAVPIIMVTALKSTEERIRAFEAGADDYISKPFHSKELITRIDSKLRRFSEVMTVPHEQKKQIHCGNLIMNLESFEVWLNGRVIRTSLLEFKLIKYLIENKGRLCRREEILQAVWESPDKSGRILDTHIMSIRKKLEKFDHVISSVYGGGYVLKPPSQSFSVAANHSV